MMDAALILAGAGWRVLPCWPDAGSQAKAPIGTVVPHGLREATADPVTIRGWWQRYPSALVGAVVPDHLTVLDIDPRNGGSIAAVEELTGRLPATLTVWSGRGDGGCHRYYRTPVGLDPTGTRLPDGVDLRKGARSYCIMPPSIHPDAGDPYRWDRDRMAQAPMPPGLVALLTPAQRVPWSGAPVTDKRVAAWLRMIREAPDGRRNETLFTVACWAVESGAIESQEGELLHAATDAGLDQREAARTVQSAVRRVS